MRRALAWLALALSCAAPACTDETVVLASIDDDADGGRRPEHARCVQPSDCPAGTYCDKPACDAPAGECRPLPVICGGEPMPVCGCDGVTYYDDCLRRVAGIAAARPGECDVDAVPCGGPLGEACPNGATCARLAGPGPCPPDVRGTCWAIPPTCPPPSGVERWDACNGGASCVDTCTAIRAGGAYHRADRCP